MNHRQDMNQPPFLCFLAVLLTSYGFVAGCGRPAPHSGKPRADVVVTVTYGGEPVTEGTVDLSNEETGEGGGGELNPQGMANIAGVALGSYTVTVVPPQPIVVPGVGSDAASPRKDYGSIPEEFRRAATSPLRATVEKDSSHFKFDLRD